EVPDLSFKAFKLRQIPQTKMVGNDFSLVTRIAILPPSDSDTNTVAIPTTPTHVVIAPAPVRQAQSASAQVTTTLTPGTQVRLVKTDAGWVLIAKDGVQLGYVQEKELLRLQ